MSERVDRDDCYICSRGHSAILQQHHIVPRRYDGSDENPNLVELCPSCHQALESLYDARFWTKVGALTADRELDVVVDDIDARLECLQWDMRRRVEETRDVLVEEYSSPDYEGVREDGLDNRDLPDIVLDAVREMQAEYDDRPGAPEDELIAAFLSKGVPQEKVEYALQKLRDEPKIYYPDQDHARLV